MALSIIALRMKLPDDVREFFRRQGKIGGKKRLETLTAEERREIARKAAQARWGKARQSNKRRGGTV